MYLHLKRWSSSDVIKVLPSQSPTPANSSMIPLNPTYQPTFSQTYSTIQPKRVGTSQDRQTTSSSLSSHTTAMSSEVTSSSSSQTTVKSLIHNPSASTSQSYVSSRQCTKDGKVHPLVASETFLFCDVCAVTQASTEFSHLACRHLFCKGCWELHFECQILQGLSTSKSDIEKVIILIEIIFFTSMIKKIILFYEFCFRSAMHVAKL